MKQLTSTRLLSKPRQQGFSLIELMITLAIVTILAAVGNSSYQAQVKKGIRADAKRTLMEMTVKQEQYMMANGAYAMNFADLNMTLPESVADNYTPAIKTWINGAESFYSVQLQTKSGAQVDDVIYNNPIWSSDGKNEPAAFWQH